MYTHENPLQTDRHVKWRPGRLYLPAVVFTGMSVGAINEGGAASFAYGQKWESSHTSAPFSKEISTFGLNGLLMGTDGMMVNTHTALPADLDVSKNIYCRLIWTCGSTDVADTVVWKVLYRELIPEVTALAVPATAFDKVIPTDNVPSATAYTMNRTEWAVINGRTLSERAEGIAFNVEMDLKAVGLTEDLFLVGLEMLYTPKRLMRGDGMAIEAPRASSMLSSMY